MELYKKEGQRLYLNPKEREAFREAAEQASREIRTFCHVMLYTGCRISEVLELGPERIDFTDKVIVVRSLKKRNPKPQYRSIPVPATLLDSLDLVHGLREGQTPKGARLWSWSRITAWRHVKEVMGKAGIEGVQASPKGLRHSFGVYGTLKAVPLHKLRDWMGHTKIETTAIYAQAVGEEERELAARMWS